MKYRILQTPDAENDVFQLADYMVNTLKNHKAANDFLNRYYQMAESLKRFPSATGESALNTKVTKSG